MAEAECHSVLKGLGASFACWETTNEENGSEGFWVFFTNEDINTMVNLFMNKNPRLFAKKSKTNV